jgi:hypothetical protein
MTSVDRMINEYGAIGGMKLNWPEIKPANTRLKITLTYLHKFSCIISSETSSWAHYSNLIFKHLVACRIKTSMYNTVRQ